MLTAQAAHINGLEPAHAAVVLYLDAREVSQDIGHLHRHRRGLADGRPLGRPDDGTDFYRNNLRGR